jgi:hypothetical protein
MENETSVSLFSKIATNDKSFNDQKSLQQIKVMSNWKFAEKSINIDDIENKQKFMEKLRIMIPLFKEEVIKEKREVKKNVRRQTIFYTDNKKASANSLIHLHQPHTVKKLKFSASERNLPCFDTLKKKEMKDESDIGIYNIFDNIVSSKTIINNRFYNNNIVKLRKFKIENGFKDCEVSRQVKNLKKDFFVPHRKTKEQQHELDIKKIITNSHFMNLITKFSIIKGDAKRYKEFCNYCYNIYGVKEPILSELFSIEEGKKAMKKSQSDNNIRKGCISQTTILKSPKSLYNKSIIDSNLSKVSLNVDKLNKTRSRNVDSLPEISFNKHTSRNHYLDSQRSMRSNYDEKATKLKVSSLNSIMTPNIDSQHLHNEYMMNNLQDSFLKSKLLLKTYSKKSEKSRENIETTYNRYFSNKGDLLEKGIIRTIARDSIGKFKEKGNFIYGTNCGYYSNSKKKLLGLI